MPSTNNHINIFPAVPGTLHDFFRTVDKVHDRRPLNAPTPLPRKKPLTAGRTNPPAVGAATGAVNAGFLRRVRPRAKAVVFPPPMPEIVSAPGARLKRDQPLTVEDLWQSPEGGPPHLDNISKEESCGICLQLLSHPVL
jgi:hypothetical protein